MTLLIGIKSCERNVHNGFNTAIRETWGSEATCDVRFFSGSAPTQIDEIQVDAPDDYDGLPLKTIAITRAFLATDHDHLFLCDTDTFVRPALLMKCGFERYDYAGRFAPGPCEIGNTFAYQDCRGIDHQECHPWASGGAGYFLSRQAAMFVAGSEPMSWAEDLHVGQVLGPFIQNGLVTAGQPDPYDGVVVKHWRWTPSFRCYETKWMYDQFAKARS